MVSRPIVLSITMNWPRAIQLTTYNLQSTHTHTHTHTHTQCFIFVYFLIFFKDEKNYIKNYDFTYVSYGFLLLLGGGGGGAVGLGANGPWGQWPMHLGTCQYLCTQTAKVSSRTNYMFTTVKNSIFFKLDADSDTSTKSVTVIQVVWFLNSK